MNKKQRKMLIRITVSAVLMIVLNFVPVQGVPRFLLYMVPYLIVGYDILLMAGKGIRNRQVFDECFLMAIATVGAIGLAIYENSGDYTEANRGYALLPRWASCSRAMRWGRAAAIISDLMDIRPDYANIERDGKLEKVDPDEVEIGSVITVQPGEESAH